MSARVPAAPYRIEPARRRYAWGSVDALPALLGEEPDGRPLAELWFGAHPAGPATVAVDGADVGLDAVLDDELPFMLKLIAAEQPLSIQVHPSAERARERFAAERAAGVAEAERRYQDANAKPEVVCALGRFDALIDFRPVDDIAADLDGAGLDTLARLARTEGVAATVRAVLTADPDVTTAAIAALVDKGNELATRLARAYPGDPGVLLATFLNHICLEAGEAAFLGPGTVHGYLGGVAVEVMATSDNVLRAGLTTKLVDVDEFLAVARCESGEPDVLHAEAAGAYPPRTDDFGLRRHVGTDDETVNGPAIIVCTDGAVTVDGLPLGPGKAVFVPVGTSAHLGGPGAAYVAAGKG